MTDWGTKSKNDREAHAGNGVKMPNNGDGTATILKSPNSLFIFLNK